VLVVGHFCSGASIPASSIYANAGVVQITPASTNPVLTERAAEGGNHTLFRTTNRDDWQGTFAGQWLAKNFSEKRLAVLDDGSIYGRSMAERVVAGAEAGGLKPVLRQTYRPRIEDFSVLINQLAAAKIDLVYVGGFHDDVAWLMKQAGSQNFQARFFSGDAMNTQKFWKLAGDAGSGLMFTDAAVHLDDPAAQAAVTALRDNGDLNDAYNMNYALNAYAAVQAFAAAATATRSTDGASVAAWLHQNTVTTAIGAISWDAKGDLTRPNYAWYVWRNGRYAPAP
jgi:branched-chain amino acid transport system substrate-binding protein